MFVHMTPPYYNPFPEAGELVSTFCVGTTKMGRYTDGAGGTYEQVIETNSVECGYISYPEAGTLITTFCAGTTLMGRYADGHGGTYDQVIQEKSYECGYLEGADGYLRINVQWDGYGDRNCDVDFEVTAPDGRQYGFGFTGGGNGLWDYDSLYAGQENVVWNPTAPNGQYKVTLVNYDGGEPGNVLVTIVFRGAVTKISMTGQLPKVRKAKSIQSIRFLIFNGSYTVVPELIPT